VDTVAEIVDSDPPEAATDEERQAYLQAALPLLFGLLRSVSDAVQFCHMRGIVNTIRIDGYIAKRILASDDLFWEQDTIQSVFGAILGLSPGNPPPPGRNGQRVAFGVGSPGALRRKSAIRSAGEALLRTCAEMGLRWGQSLNSSWPHDPGSAPTTRPRTV
jgi:hypothetical protein